MDTVGKNLLLQMKKLNKAMLKAKKMEGKSVVYLRKEVLEEAIITLEKKPNIPLSFFGVKNTGQIDMEIIRKLQKEDGFLFHTIDKMSERGRAIDIDLINPLTGRVMTGSSSGGCVNILRGINDIAIGTDGGGSVLAPAMSTGLFSIMAKGLGLKGKDKRISTDNINFTPGIGVISHDYNLCKRAIGCLCNINKFDCNEFANRKLKIAIPKKGSIVLPNGKDMREILDKVISEINHLVKLEEKDFSGIGNRRNSISLCEDLFNNDIDIIITAEGPVDLYGRGDSVIGEWGNVGLDLQNNSGKYLLKSANIVDATAVTIPTEDLSMGILIVAKKGIDAGKSAIELGDIIRKLYLSHELFDRYFIEGYIQKDIGLL